MLSSTDNIQDDSDPALPNIGKLTKHPVGSLRELLTIAFPLMLTSLSGTLMLFIDRLVIAHVSSAAMNGVASATMVFAIFQFGLIGITGIAEVFVGQYNGAKQYKDLARPVWQMIWFSLLCAIPLMILGLGFADWFLPAETAAEGTPFLSCMFCFGFLFPLNAALASFFIGQGKVKMVAWYTLFSSVLNILLDFLLIFGFGPLEGLGVLGAGLATGLSQLALACMLFKVFYNASNHQQFNTRIKAFDFSLLKRCLNVAVPNALGHTFSMAAWTLFMFVLAKASFAHMTIFSITQCIWILLSFIAEGNQKAISAVCANLIGADKSNAIPKVFRSGIMMQVYIIATLAIPCIVFPDLIIYGFLNVNDPMVDDNLIAMSITACQLMLLALTFDGILWMLSGVLTAAGDTRFIMIANTLSSWLFGLMPCYFFVAHLEANALIGMYLTVIYCFITMVCFFLRYKSKDWGKRYSLI